MLRIEYLKKFLLSSTLASLIITPKGCRNGFQNKLRAEGKGPEERRFLNLSSRACAACMLFFIGHFSGPVPDARSCVHRLLLSCHSLTENVYSLSAERFFVL
ncbi:hypothetical protein Salat_0759600 [Sesamum alatum]|uniref:Uncharacterized protein n=1 Tax=Sesamum alatum TaxID=300844 RepID=A0AAE1YT17_9LAMI|nr:hypothetical protein Salat_0759600 [Sesamum alatum]